MKETAEGQQRRRIEERKKEKDSVFAGLGFFELEKPSLKKTKQNIEENTFLFIMEKANKCVYTCLEREGCLAFSNSCYFKRQNWLMLYFSTTSTTANHVSKNTHMVYNQVVKCE